MTKLSIIVAIAHNGVIGLNNILPWHLPEDLKRFRELTTGHHIIMGRKTYESLGRLLPGRTTVIVTRNKNYHIKGALIAYSLEQALSFCGDDSEAFLIGGAELYQAGLNLADKLYMTEVDLDVEGDAFFPQLDLTHWQELDRQSHVSDKGVVFNYVNYQR